jgi:hypothetical protein
MLAVISAPRPRRDRGVSIDRLPQPSRRLGILASLEETSWQLSAHGFSIDLNVLIRVAAIIRQALAIAHW